MEFDLSDRLETLREDIEMDLRNGMVSADTKLITKAILLVALQLKEICVDTEEIATETTDISAKIERCSEALFEIDKTLYSDN